MYKFSTEIRGGSLHKNFTMTGLIYHENRNTLNSMSSSLYFQFQFLAKWKLKFQFQCLTKIILFGVVIVNFWK